MLDLARLIEKGAVIIVFVGRKPRSQPLLRAGHLVAQPPVKAIGECARSISRVFLEMTTGMPHDHPSNDSLGGSFAIQITVIGSHQPSRWRRPLYA